MTTKHERADLQAACDFLRLSPDELVAWAPQSGTKRMRRMRRPQSASCANVSTNLHTDPDTEE